MTDSDVTALAEGYLRLMDDAEPACTCPLCVASVRAARLREGWGDRAAREGDAAAIAKVYIDTLGRPEDGCECEVCELGRMMLRIAQH